MAGAGNIYRHDYEDVAARLVWDTVQLALPPLRDIVARELAGDARIGIMWDERAHADDFAREGVDEKTVYRSRPSKAREATKGVK